MVEKHTFGPIPLDVAMPFVRADLELYGINTFCPSYVAMVFFNDDTLHPDAVSEDRASFAGRFAVFGHSQCSGDEGHCEVPSHRRRFDDRPSSPLTPGFKRVVVTDCLRRELDAGTKELSVTIFVFPDPSAEHADGALELQGMQLAYFA